MNLPSVYIFNWVFILALFPVSFFWLRRAWRIAVKRDFSEVALKKGVPPPNAEKYAPYEMAINLVGGVVLVGVLVAVLGFQAMKSEDWIATAGITLWVKLLLSFALGRQAHGLGPANKPKPILDPEEKQIYGNDNADVRDTEDLVRRFDGVYEPQSKNYRGKAEVK